MKMMTPAHPGCYYFQPAIVQEHVMWLDDLATAAVFPTVVNVDHRVWWKPGKRTLCFLPTRF